MSKLEYFRKYLDYKRNYYAGSPVISDHAYDQYEQVCRNHFPDDADFHMPGYGQAHEDRLKELEA